MMNTVNRGLEQTRHQVFVLAQAKSRLRKLNSMPPVSHPFKMGAMVVLMNYSDHAPPHVHVKYQGEVGEYRIEIKTRTWMKSGKELPPTLRRLIETWVEAHEPELLEQWENARQHRPVSIVG
jgi:hypothetical protein